MTPPMTPRMTPRRAGRGDTVYGWGAVALSLLLIGAGSIALLTTRHSVAEVRERLSSTVATVAGADHVGPRDPRILPEVARRLPPYISLQPRPDYRRSGQLLLRWHRDGATGSVCLVVSDRPGGPITACRHRVRGA